MTIRLCVNNVHIRSFSSPYFPAFGLNSNIYSVNRHIHSEGVNIPEKTPNTGVFYVVRVESKDLRSRYLKPFKSVLEIAPVQTTLEVAPIKKSYVKIPSTLPQTYHVECTI